MRPSRTILATALVAAPVAAALGLLGGDPTVAAASITSVTAPVASAPAVVATSAPAPRHVAPKPKPATHAVTHPATHVAARRVTTRRVATPKHAVSHAPVAPKPAATHSSKATTTPAARTGNDYPYAGATTNASDKWGFTERQCVSFAAWRLARNGHPLDNRTQNWGSAFHWDDAARAHGVRVSSTPHVGAIAQWNAGEGGTVWVGGGKGRFTAGEYGHVGYVSAVYSDGSVLVEQYNVQGNREYSVMRMTAPRYLF